MAGKIQDDMEISIATEQIKRVDVKDILEYLFRKADRNQKSILTYENLDALMRMRSANAYLRKYFGFRIEAWDLLIEDKLEYIISVNARGREDIIRTIQAMRESVVQEEPEKRKGWI